MWVYCIRPDKIERPRGDVGRKRERETDRERKKERLCVGVCVYVCVCSVLLDSLLLATKWNKREQYAGGC